MSSVTFDKQTDNAWQRLYLSKYGNGIMFPFALGDTIGWDDCYHRHFINTGTVIAVYPPSVIGNGGCCMVDGTYHLLGSTKISDFRIEIKPKFLYSENLISTTFNGQNIHKLRSARMVIIEKIKKIDIYKNNE